MFGQDGSCPALLEDTIGGFPYGAVTRYGPPFQAVPVPVDDAAGLFRVRSPLLTESRLMSVPPATEMFQFAGFASPSYRFRRRYPLTRVGCPIRRSRDRRSLASPPGFSQRAASFVASQCQGIHQMPLIHARSACGPPPAGPAPQGHAAVRRPENRRAQGQAPPGRPAPRGDPPARHRFAGGPTPPAASHEDASSDNPSPGSRPKGQKPCPAAVRLGHIHKSASPFNQHRRGIPRRQQHRPGAPRPTARHQPRRPRPSPASPHGR
jgi:hypothetical protein